jgi:hypothetical protein
LTGFIPGMFIMVLTCIYTYFIFKEDTAIERPAGARFSQVIAILRKASGR